MIKEYLVAFPPNRSNEEIKKFTKGSLIIGRKNFADSQFKIQQEAYTI